MKSLLLQNSAAKILTKFLQDSKSQKFQTGAIALLTCPFGQKISGGASHITCQDGKWSAKLGTCEKANLIFF